MFNKRKPTGRGGAHGGMSPSLLSPPLPPQLKGFEGRQRGGNWSPVCRGSDWGKGPGGTRDGPLFLFFLPVYGTQYTGPHLGAWWFFIDSVFLCPEFGVFSTGG